MPPADGRNGACSWFAAPTASEASRGTSRYDAYDGREDSPDLARRIVVLKEAVSRDIALA